VYLQTKAAGRWRKGGAKVRGEGLTTHFGKEQKGFTAQLKTFFTATNSKKRTEKKNRNRVA